MNENKGNWGVPFIFKYDSKKKIWVTCVDSSCDSSSNWRCILLTLEQKIIILQKMSATTYTAQFCPKLSIPQVNCISSAPSSPVGVEATITLSAKKPNKMSTASLESNESSDPLESDYCEDEDENDSASDEEEEYESSQKNNSESDEDAEDNEDDNDEDDDNVDKTIKGHRTFSLDDFQILKTVGKFLILLINSLIIKFYV